MNEIIDITALGHQIPQTVPSIMSPPHGAPAPRSSDTVDLSPLGRSLLKGASTVSSLRRARIAAIHDEIQSGRYETAEKVAGTIERLLDVLG